MGEERSPAFYWLAAFFGLFVLFLYGPMIVIFVLSFQGPTGGLTFPMNGVSLHWFERLWNGGGIVNIHDAFTRSLELGFVIMILTVLLSLPRHVRDLQSLRQSLRRGGARSRRDTMADPALRDLAYHPAFGDRRRILRLHPVLGRDRAIEPGDGRAQSSAYGIPGPDPNRDAPRDLRPRHGDDGRVLRRNRTRPARNHDDTRPPI